MGWGVSVIPHPNPPPQGGRGQELQMTPIVEFDAVSKWYGNVIGLNKLTLRIPAGVTCPTATGT